MPDGDAVAKALSSAKSTLAHANAAFPSSAAPARPAAPAPAPAKTATLADELKAKQDNVKRYTSAPAMHTGGPVPADGVYRLQAGEHVLTAAEAANARKHAMMAAGMKSLAKPAKKIRS